ncbi:hypothetical protein [Halalkalicoccus salilacus]|uniref:hypothetical protein n=1 Tax=Halalkalicoccus TaxID=332246 RepID=UPI002F96E8B9
MDIEEFDKFGGSLALSIVLNADGHSVTHWVVRSFDDGCHSPPIREQGVAACQCGNPVGQ